MPDCSTLYAYIALGSNMDNPLQQVNTAVEEIHQLPDCEITRVSKWYCSEPLKSAKQDDFINGVVEVSTSLSPIALLEHLQSIEQAHHRQRTEHWGSRTLDLDILLYDNLNIKTSRLSIPHPEIGHRNFVLLPLLDIKPTLSLPDGTSLHNLLENCPTRGIVALEEGGLSGKFN